MEIQNKTDNKKAVAIDAHIRMWEVIRNGQLDGFKFIRQVLVAPFIVDFACEELKLIVELDGATDSEQHSCDLRRTEYLRNKGYAVIRFWCNEVLTNMGNVVATLRSELAHKSGGTEES